MFLRFLILSFTVLSSAFAEPDKLEVQIIVPPALSGNESDGRMPHPGIMPYGPTGPGCTNIPPGLDRLRMGVDITKLDLLPFTIGGDDGYRQPVVDYTCFQGRGLGIGTGRLKQYYQLPDQVSSVAQVPSGVLQETVSVYQRSGEVLQAMAVAAGLAEKSKIGIFTASASYLKMLSTMFNYSRNVETVRSIVSAYRADLAPPWALSLSGYASSYINDLLPDTFDEAPEKYARFIDRFGTCFPVHIKLGGAIRLILETEKIYFRKNALQAIKVQAKAIYMNELIARGYAGLVKKEVDEQFLERTIKTIRYYGGDVNSITNGIERWHPTVRAYPWVIGGQYTPIWTLIRNEAKKVAMQRAVEVHLDKARLRALAALVHGKMQRYAQVPEMEAMLQRIYKYIGDPSPVHAEVENLITDVEEQLLAPDWFWRVELCQKWEPEEERAQCGGSGVGREICRRIDGFTQFYLDDTDERDGGCRLSWGLKAPSWVPKWFKDTEICFRWAPDGDVAQCGSGCTGRQLCARVNHFTQPYRDDTDDREGGCKMSWGLRAKSSTPLWTRNLDLCFEWRADGDAQQCGDGRVGRTMCAPTNEWTGNYVDDTDDREGGCQMRWGIMSN